MSITIIIITIPVAACNHRIREEAGNGVGACNSVHCCASCGRVPEWFLCLSESVCSPVATAYGFRYSFTCVRLR